MKLPYGYVLVGEEIAIHEEKASSSERSSNANFARISDNSAVIVVVVVM